MLRAPEIDRVDYLPNSGIPITKLARTGETEGKALSERKTRQSSYERPILREIPLR